MRFTWHCWEYLGISGSEGCVMLPARWWVERSLGVLYLLVSLRLCLSFFVSAMPFTYVYVFVFVFFAFDPLGMIRLVLWSSAVPFLPLPFLLHTCHFPFDPSL